MLTEHYAGGRVVALSAGTQPGDHIHPEVADVLEKLGLDTSGEQPKLLTRETVAASTMAITLGCGEECPYVPGVTYVDWPVADPGGQDEATVRAIIADLDGRVRALLVELVPDIELPRVSARPTPEARPPARSSGVPGRCGVRHQHGGDRSQAGEHQEGAGVRARAGGQHGPDERRDRRGDERRCGQDAVEGAVRRRPPPVRDRGACTSV